MKEKNQYYSKNVESNTYFFSPEGPITQNDYNLLLSSKNMDYNSLSQLIKKNVDFNNNILSCALGNLIQNYKDNESFNKCFELLFSTNLNLNYKLADINNKTLLMSIKHKFSFNLIKLFLDSISNKINSNKNLSSDEIEKYQISTIKEIFSQKDNDGNNFFHLFFSIDKLELYRIFSYIYDEFPASFEGGAIKSIQKIFQNLFLEKNDNGDTLMSISFQNNNIQIIFRLLLINGYKPNVNKNNNNLVHCAVLSKAINCLKIILYYCSNEDLSMKNEDGLTPAQLASKLGLSIINSVINEYQNNFNEDKYKEHFYKNYEIYKYKINNSKEDFLTNFTNYKYKEILFELKEFQLIYQICNDNNNNNILQINKNNNDDSTNEENILYKISLYKIEWNIILCKIKLFIDKSEPNINKDEKDELKTSFSNLYKKIYEFYKNNFTNNYIISLIKAINQINKEQPLEINNSDIFDSGNIISSYKNTDKPFELLIYNKIIFHFKFGSYKPLIETIQIYIKEKYIPDSKINNIDITDKKRFILFVNFSCILIETLISQGYKRLSQIIIKSLERYLFQIRQPISDKIEHYTPLENNIFNYLTKTGVLHQYSAYFSEIFCYINYLKILNNQENNKDKEYFTQIKKFLNESIYAKDPIIFEQLGTLYPFIEMKKIYENEKEEKKINDILHGIKYTDENAIYYLNTLGIIFLKKQKFNLSKYFFTKGYQLYIQAIKNKKEKLNKLYNFRIDIITVFLYNISLCYFHMKQYNKCITILECLLNFKSNQNNYFMHYRLGLSYYYAYVESYNKNSDYFNKNIIKLIGYEKIKNYKKRENIKQLSIELDNEGIISNLSQKFEAEHKKKSLKDKHENKFSFHNNDRNEKSDKAQHKYNNIYKSGKNLGGNNNYNNHSFIKKIVLKNSTKLINNTNNFFGNKKLINTNNNIIDKTDFLNKAIKHFKKVIHISKLNELNIYSDSMKSLYDFYSSYMEVEKKKDDINIEDNFSKDKKIPNELLINSYFNLLMCLSIKQNWLEMNLIIKDYYNRDLMSNKIIELKIWLYELEASINLKNNKMVKEIISKIKKFKKIGLSVLNKSNNDVINEINIKLYIYYTLTRIYVEEKNFKEVDINIKKIFFLLKDIKNIPYYIIDLLLNVYIIKLKSESNINNKTKYRYNNIILNLIKHKKLNEE